MADTPFFAQDDFSFCQLIDLVAAGFVAQDIDFISSKISSNGQDTNLSPDDTESRIQILKEILKIVAQDYHILASQGKVGALNVQVEDYESAREAFRTACTTQKLQLLQSGHLRETNTGGLEFAA